MERNERQMNKTPNQSRQRHNLRPSYSKPTVILHGITTASLDKLLRHCPRDLVEKANNTYHEHDLVEADIWETKYGELRWWTKEVNSSNDRCASSICIECVVLHFTKNPM